MAKKKQENCPVIVDIESHYNTETGYSLSKMSTAEYVHSLQSHVYLTGLYDTYDDTYHVAEHGDIPALLEDRNIKNRIMAAHNCKFDAAMLFHHFDCMPRFFMCTQLMAVYLLGTPSKYPSFRNITGGTNSLDNLSKFFSLPSGKKQTESLAVMNGMYDMSGLSEGNRKKMFQYQRQDVILCGELLMILKQFVPKAQLLTINWAIREFVDPILKLDPNLFEDVIALQAEGMDELLLELNVSLKDLRSVAKFSQLLMDAGMDQRDLPTKVSAKGNNIFAFAKNDPGFIKLKHHPNKQVRNLVEARVAAQSSILRTRAEKYLAVAKATGNLWPVDIVPSGAHTHRPTGGDGGGGNPLNLPRPPKHVPETLHGSELRRGIKAPKGYYLLYFDYTAIELRICRWGVNDTSARITILAGEDIYKTLAAVIHQVEYEDVDDDMRWLGKQLQLALQYGVSAKAMTLRLEQGGRMFALSEVESMVDTFRKRAHRAVPEGWKTCTQIIDMWVKGADRQENYDALAKKLNFPGAITPEGIQWPSGRLLRYPNVKKMGDRDIMYRLRGPQFEPKKLYGASLLENISQSLANEIIDEKQRRIEKELGFRCPLQVYDSIVAVVPNSIKPKDAGKQVRQIACEPVSWWQDQPPLDIEMAAGRTYYDCK